MEADKVQRVPAGFPFQLCVPASSPSTLFPPMPIFGVQAMYATLLQHQLLQLQQQSQPQQSPNCLLQDLSPGLSDRASSGAESPSTKKLQLDDNGCPICPACGEKIQESEFASHVEMERNKLLNTIEGAKESKIEDKEITTTEGDPVRRKRESEFNRIRGNHLKRIALKRGTAGIRDSLTPFSRQSNDESGSTGSPEIKKEEDAFGNIKCSSCLRSSDYGIVCSTIDQPRCQDCFDQIRNTTNTIQQSSSSSCSSTSTILNASIPCSISSLLEVPVASATSPSSSSSVSFSPPEKKMKVN